MGAVRTGGAREVSPGGTAAMGVSNIRMPFMADQDDSCFGWGMRGQRREVKREGKKTQIF